MPARAGGTSPGIPLGDDAGTIPCPACPARFRPTGRQRYCTSACRHTAWRRAHPPHRIPIVVPPGAPRRPVTVYECPTCASRAVGEQRCDECGTFRQRVGLGGLCPHCDEPVTLGDLIDGLDKP